MSQVVTAAAPIPIADTRRARQNVGARGAGPIAESNPCCRTSPLFSTSRTPRRTERTQVTPENLFTRNEHDTTLDTQLVDQLRRGPLLRYRDEDAAYCLVRLLEDELPVSDTDSRGLTDQNVADLLRCTNAVLTRLSIDHRIPWRTRRAYWEQNSGMGAATYHCGRILTALAQLEEAASRTGIRGVNGDLRNVIFAATQKPEFVWVDFPQQILEITKNAEHCLKYDRPIPSAGITVTDLLSWWSARDGIHHLRPAAQLQQLKNQFDTSCPDSPLERDLLRIYWRFAEARGFATTPAIFPQVYLHYDPVSQDIRDRTGGRKIPFQKKDFMLFAPGHRRIILEIDGREHYSTNGNPSPREYAKMTKEDRRLSLQGYEVYRFGGYEFQPSQDPDTVLTAFFTDLFADQAPERTE
ncbi:hypothetical protein [Streptomyces sp. 604F]|uniref:hypothetical protein n=1 Tax=Streptomyces sp. 604F TaxID=1476754 RepID=UPI0013DD0623|nr:hypothetical protein [Streptomyces sp. 604F]